MSDPSRTDLLHRALVAYRSADDDLAESLALQILALDQTDEEAHMLLGNLYGRQGQPGEAVTQFYKALETSPNNPEAWNNVGVMLRTLGQLPQALEALEKARSLGSENAGVLYNLGNVLKQMGRMDAAVEAYEASLVQNPGNAFTYNNLGTIYENQGDLEMAQDTYLRGLEADPNNPTLRYNLGLVYQRNNELRLARQSFEAALRGRPGWKAGMNNLGVTLHKMGQKDEALELFEEMVRDDPENPEALNNMGVLYQEMGRTEDAEARFAQALRVNPRYGKAVLNLDALYTKEGRADRSLDLLGRYSLLEPENLTVRLQLAKLRLFQNSPEKAEEDLLAVLAKQPNNLDALRTLGNLYLKTRRDYLTQKVADRIKKIDPSCVDLHMDMALNAMNDGETGTAVEQVKIYLRARPEDQNARLLLANLYQKQGRTDDARHILEKLRAEDHQNTAVLGALARLKMESGDQESALELADAILRVQGHESAGDELELMLETLEMYEKAAETLGTDLQETWQRNLRTLAQPLEAPAAEPETVEEQPVVEEPDWMQPREEEEAPSLLDLGDLNPLILVSEEEETLKITEEEEILGLDEAWDEEILVEEDEEIALPAPKPVKTTPAPEAPAPAPAPPAPAPFQERRRQPWPPAPPPPTYIFYPPPAFPPPVPPAPPPAAFPPPPVTPPQAPPAPGPKPPLEEPWDEPLSTPDLIDFREPVPTRREAEFPEEPEELPPDLWVPEDTPAEDVPEPEFSEPGSPDPDDGAPALERPGKIADLIGYLEDLSHYLPEDQRRRLEEDTMPLKMEKIRRNLAGTPGPRVAGSLWPVKGEAPSVTKQKLKALMGRLKEKLAE